MASVAMVDVKAGLKISLSTFRSALIEVASIDLKADSS